MKELRLKDGTIVEYDNYQNDNFKAGVIIADGHEEHFGNMGCDVESFILSLSPDYFASRFCSQKFTINILKTITNLRKSIREEIPFYKYMDFQKILRQEIKKLESCHDSHELYDKISELPNKLSYDLTISGGKLHDVYNFIDIIKPIFSEPTHLMYEEHSSEYARIWRQLKEIKNLIIMNQKLRTFNGTVIPENTRAVLYLCDFSDRKTLKINSTLCFNSISEGTIVYSEIPNPESQLITGKTFEELRENLKKFHEIMTTEKFLENLRESL